MTDTAKTLDRAKWHRPPVSVIVTHHNYSDHVEDALLSVIDQSYENWECVIVDDASTPAHQQRLRAIVEALGSNRIRILELAENVGQTQATYAGLDATTGEFVCILDPDDRYAQSFIEEAVAGHLNETVYCPLLSTDQYLVRDGHVITGTYIGKNLAFADRQPGGTLADHTVPGRLLYFPADHSGWHWGSTSSLMFRRPAMELMRPQKSLTYFRSVDSYLAQGAHRIGGCLVLTRPLVYRTVHRGNSYLVDGIFALGQDKGRYDGASHSRLCLADALDAIKANGGEKHIVTPKRRKARGTLQRWRRSIGKRWTAFKHWKEIRHAG